MQVCESVSIFGACGFLSACVFYVSVVKERERELVKGSDLRGAWHVKHGKTRHIKNSSNLVKKDEKDDVVPKTADAIQHRHLDDERENVIDERVQRL